MTDAVSVSPLGDCAALVSFGAMVDDAAHAKVNRLSAHLESRPFAGFVECVPAYASLTVVFDPLICPYAAVEAHLAACLSITTDAPYASTRLVGVPVCYGGAHGPDLAAVAAYHNVTQEDVVRMHSGAVYKVYMLGFAPGFPYLGGMPQELATPRRDVPRIVVPAGSVGIASGQTGVYPLDTPGGWQLIGRTPVRLFRPEMEPPTLLRAGDTVRFLPITEEQYLSYEEADPCGGK